MQICPKWRTAMGVFYHEPLNCVYAIGCAPVSRVHQIALRTGGISAPGSRQTYRTTTMFMLANCKTSYTLSRFTLTTRSIVQDLVMLWKRDLPGRGLNNFSRSRPESHKDMLGGNSLLSIIHCGRDVWFCYEQNPRWWQERSWKVNINGRN